jgi:glycosyltransferase involved in cell wall biosynthesis
MRKSAGRRSLIVVTSHAGQASCAELARQSARGERPRKDYVELARVLGADVMDDRYLEDRANVLSRAVARRLSRHAGEAIEAFIRGGTYEHICAWSDRIGLPLALMHKLARARRDLVLISSWLSAPKPAFFLRDLGVHTHLRGIVSYSSQQNRIAASRLGVPAAKLHLALQPVDEQFWKPLGTPSSNLICAVGFSGRDYETLFAAVRGVDVDVQLAVGGGELPADVLERRLRAAGPPSNARMAHFGAPQLRRLYSSARFVVVPLEDVEYDAGVTTITEAMSMGKAVVVTRTRGQIDLIQDGVQGMYVPARDPRAMRAAIERLLADPAEADRMGRAGRALVERQHTLTGYVARLAAIVRGEALPAADAEPSRSPREVEAHGHLAEVPGL